MVKDNLLLWHIGLGDALICNGLVRALHERLGQLTLPVLPKYQSSIDWMFSDLPGVTTLPLTGFDDLTNDLGLRRHHLDGIVALGDYNVIALGYLNESAAFWKGQRTFDQAFYDQADVPFEFKWSRFFHRRHPDQLAPPAEPYVFVHMDARRQYTFEPQIGGDYRIVTNEEYQTDNFFRLQDLLEHAQEIHVMESSFSNWLELMPEYRDRRMVVYDTKHQSAGPAFPMLKRRPWQRVVPPCPTRGFVLNVRGSANRATLTVTRDEPRTFAIDVTRAGRGDIWDIQLREPNLPVVAGTIYEITFRARAAAPREIAFGVNDRRFSNLGAFARTRIGPEWQEFRHAFTPLRSDDGADLHFDLGGTTGLVELAGIALRRLADGAAAAPTVILNCACWPPAPEPDHA